MALCPRVKSSLYCTVDAKNINCPYSTGTLSLTNGGPAGAIWVFLAVCLGMGSSVLSMAEMASLLVVRLLSVILDTHTV